MSVFKKLGDTLELEIQLGDGAKFPSTRVFSRIEELDGTILTSEFELNNEGDGSYTEETHTMPTNGAIKVLYFIRKSNGTSPETKYNPRFLSEIFVRDIIGELIENNLDAKVSNIGGAVADIVAVANSDTGLEGALIEEILLGTIEQDTIIEGVVNES